MTSEDLPEPETPVTTLRSPTGTLRVTLRRLWPQAPESVSQPRSGLRRSFGTGIFSSPLRYLPVRERSLAMTSSGVPAARTSPPFSPAPGPMSTR